MSQLMFAASRRLLRGSAVHAWMTSRAEASGWSSAKLFSSVTVPTTMTIPTSTALYTTINFAARTWKTVKMVALVAGVFSLGFQQGTIEYSRDPERKQEVLLDTILAQHKCDSKMMIQRFENADGLEPKARAQFMKEHPQLKLVVAVGSKVVQAAESHIQAQVNNIADTPGMMEARMPWSEAFAEVDKLKRWARADRTMKYGPWTFTIIPSDVPKLSMSEILPRQVFVTTALLEKIENEDELAFLMGIEMSHLLLGHNAIENLVETGLRTVQVLALSIDPTEGILSLAFVAALEWLREFVMKSGINSYHQGEADVLGLTLAAMACYDTTRALKVVTKFPLERPKLQLLGTVRTDDRFSTLQKLAETEKLSKYDRCIKIRKRFLGIF